MADDAEESLVLLFKAPKAGNDPYEKLLRENGFACSSIQVLGFEFTHLDELTELIKRLDHYSAILFASQRAVEAVELSMKSFQDDDKIQLRNLFQKVKCYTVGESTAESARKAGFCPCGEHTGNAEQLSKYIIEDLQSAGLPLLYPCGSLRKDTLPVQLKQAGFQIEEVEVYKTVKSPSIEQDLRAVTRSMGQPKFVVFFSPSGVQYTEDLVDKGVLNLSSIKVVSIGPSTLEELKRRNISVHSTAASPTPQGILAALQQNPATLT